MASADQDANARYLTVFVSLCDVPSERGPMEIWCGTQNMYIPWKGTEAADISDCSACSEQSDEDNGPVVAEDYEVEHEDELTLKLVVNRGLGLCPKQLVVNRGLGLCPTQLVVNRGLGLCPTLLVVNRGLGLCPTLLVVNRGLGL
eukprot:gene9709-11507_t